MRHHLCILKIFLVGPARQLENCKHELASVAVGEYTHGVKYFFARRQSNLVVQDTKIIFSCGVDTAHGEVSFYTSPWWL